MAIAAVSIFVIQADRLRNHYMIVLVPLVPYVFLRFGPAFSEVQVRRFAALISLAGVALVATLVGKYFVETSFCKSCEDHVPYDAHAEQLRAAGFIGGTVFAYFHFDPLAGNLRVRFPNARIVSAKHPGVIPPRGGAPGQCLIVWPMRGADDPKSATIHTANKSPLNTGLDWNALRASRTRAPVPPWDGTVHELGFVLLKDGAGDCR
ncbi:MAG: hypothetical protein VW405_03075 [Rhodospirillaceae bacterium]